MHQRITQPPILIHGGEHYFSQLEALIARAQEEIHLQTYIFEDDTAGKRIIKALETAASRGVKVLLLLDAYGSKGLSRKLVKEMESSGIKLRFFAPLLSLNTLHLGRRLHHKVLVVDRKQAILGGINIADHYLGTPGNKCWLDYAVLLEDPLVEYIADICDSLFYRRRRKLKKATKVSGQLQILRNDWFRKKHEIYQAYVYAIQHAKREIVICGSYFLPGSRLISALKQASRRGVRVRILMAGFSDLPLQKALTQDLYQNFKMDAIEFYEWKGSVLHAKAAVVDGHWVTIGSFNLNNLSSYASIEMNAAIESKGFAREFQDDLEKIFQQSEKVNIEPELSVFSRVVGRTSFFIARMAMGLLTFFPYRRSFSRYISE